jgi:short subunit dehydrogenase-like uncharacterized protein
MTSNKYALTVFGATGFTGERCAREAAKRVPPGFSAGKYSWAVAGRDRARLKEVVDRLELGTGVPAPEIVVADSSNEGTIKEMCQNSTVLVNCVGPFRFHGEQVVSACVEAGSDYVDITGEPEFAENVVLKYHRQAQKTGSTVVSYCGYDSLPAELGTLMVKKAFAEEGAVCSQVEMAHQVDYDERLGLTVNL